MVKGGGFAQEKWCGAVVVLLRRNGDGGSSLLQQSTGKKEELALVAWSDGGLMRWGLLLQALRAESNSFSILGIRPYKVLA